MRPNDASMTSKRGDMVTNNKQQQQQQQQPRELSKQQKHLIKQLEKLQLQQQHQQQQQQQQQQRPPRRARSRTPNSQREHQPQQPQQRQQPSNDGPDLVKRCQIKFQKLEETCMERYVAREQRVISTLNFCMTALEQLRSWAVFAIFPLDEQHSDKYITFVEQRYSCIVVPLRLFSQALYREQNHQPIIGHHRGVTSPREFASSPRDGSRNSPRESLSGSSISSVSSPFNYDPNSSQVLGSAPQQAIGSLRDRINQISHQYLQEGVTIKDTVVERLVKCRKEMRIIYRWGQASLLDLQDVFDESLADELYYMVRGKMARVISAISVFEEASDQIERSLSHHMQRQQDPQQGYTDDESELDGLTMPPRSFSNLSAQDLGQYNNSTPPMSIDGDHQLTNGYDLRVDLQPLIDAEPEEEDALAASGGSLMTSNSSGGLRHFRHGSDSDLDLFEGDVAMRSDCGSGGSGGTPEPPLSPRPRYLGSHPKIMKDKLQNLALPSKFPVSPRMSTAW